ncbi:MAG: hypothetical protein KF819_21610 [Labilithrix sp.]|nr:hypothetical protein [Labilithrix sp.]
MPRPALVALGIVLVVAGLGSIVAAPTNNALEGWGMLLRGLLGQGLLVGGVDCVARARPNATPRRARRAALAASSIVLLPFAALVLLVSKESGSSWGTAALILIAWLFCAAIYAAVRLATDRR